MPWKSEAAFKEAMVAVETEAGKHRGRLGTGVYENLKGWRCAVGAMMYDWRVGAITRDEITARYGISKEEQLLVSMANDLGGTEKVYEAMRRIPICDSESS